jgi:hypothetical protein
MRRPTSTSTVSAPRVASRPRVRTAAKQSSKRVQDVAYRAQVAFAELALTVTMLTFADV